MKGKGGRGIYLEAVGVLRKLGKVEGGRRGKVSRAAPQKTLLGWTKGRKPLLLRPPPAMGHCALNSKQCLEIYLDLGSAVQSSRAEAEAQEMFYFGVDVKRALINPTP